MTIMYRDLADRLFLAPSTQAEEEGQWGLVQASDVLSGERKAYACAVTFYTSVLALRPGTSGRAFDKGRSACRV